MKRSVSRILSLLLCVAMAFSLAMLPALAADEQSALKSVYASYADKGHTNAPLTDDVYKVTGDTVKISILTTSDMHGRAYDWNSYTNSPLAGNYLQAAQVIAAERADSDDSIVIDVGDVLQGTALSSYNNTQETGKNSPMATALRYIDYDVFNLGNHEFNYSPQVQWNFYNYLSSTDATLPGSPVSVVCANVVEKDTQESVFAPYKLFPYTFADGTTYTVGVLCFENMNNANWDVASHYEGCDFGHADNTAKSYVYEYETYWQKELQAKCDYLIVAMHCGDGSLTDYDQQNQAAWFAAHTNDVDLILTGHDHVQNASYFTNKDGKKVPVLNGGSSSVAELELTLAKSGKTVTASAGEPALHTFKAEASVPAKTDGAAYKSGNEAYDGLKAILQPAFQKADTFVNKQIGTVSGSWDSVSSYNYDQTDSYDLVHKAQIWAATTSCGIDPAKAHVVSLTTPVASTGFTVSSLIADGKTSAPISLKDCYSLYKYDNNTLYMIKLTGKQLTNWIQATNNTFKINDGTDLNPWSGGPAGTMGGGGYGTDQFYGVNYEVYIGNDKGSRVYDITYADGTPMKDTDEIYVCLSSYRLSATANSDEYGWFAATGVTSNSPEVVWDATVSDEFNTVGGSVPLIIGEYIKSLTKAGKNVTAGSSTHWNVFEGAYKDYTHFADIKSSDWYYADAMTSGYKGLFDGYTDGGFHGQDTLTRAQFVTLLWRMAGKPAPTGAVSFSDVPAGTYYTDAVAWAAENKIVEGDGTGKFLPGATVTREQMAAFLYRYAAFKTYDTTKTADLSAFPDASGVSAWAKAALSWANAEGLVKGVAGSGVLTLSPQKGCSRAEAASVLVRMLDAFEA